MKATEEKPQQINELVECCSSVRASSGQNGQGTGQEIGTPLTQLRSLDVPETRAALIAMRLKVGAKTHHGQILSNLIEQLENLQTYVRPEWATDERQTLPYMIKRQLARLAQS